ncbi:MAG: hypothetical protein JNJ71_16305 [Rubrivivax sp.]|nr:hypothetical protein [Rubrivivax sp.]
MTWRTALLLAALASALPAQADCVPPQSFQSLAQSLGADAASSSADACVELPNLYAPSADPAQRTSGAATGAAEAGMRARASGPALPSLDYGQNAAVYGWLARMTGESQRPGLREQIAAKMPRWQHGQGAAMQSIVLLSMGLLLIRRKRWEFELE